MFDDSVDVADLDKLPAEYKELLVHQLLTNGEAEISAGDTYIDSLYPLAPNADERYLCAQFAMEEIGHFRYFARLLAAVGVDAGPMVLQPKASRRYFPADAVNVPFYSWEERGAFSFLFELEGHYQLKEMLASTYAPLREVMPTILKEEAGHFAHGVKLMRQAREGEAAMARAQAALDRFFPIALDLFGKSNSRRSEAAVRWGLRKHENGELRDIYKEDIGRQITKLGYRVPPDDPSRRKFL
jgi:ring-1,2-phenylacetyl-CoA epoxidase subunit PaaA